MTIILNLLNMETLKRAFRFQNCKENLKGEKSFENIYENYVPNVKDHVLSTFVTKDEKKDLKET